MNNNGPNDRMREAVCPFPASFSPQCRTARAGNGPTPRAIDRAFTGWGQTLFYPVLYPRPLALPLFADTVAAGFPNPAEEFIEGRLDLNRHLIPHPAATFFVRVAGDSMVGAGIHPGDLLIVDRSLEARHGRVIIAVVDNELTVKRLHCRGGSIRLLAENDRYPPIEIVSGMTLEVWGVVTNVIHAL